MTAPTRKKLGLVGLGAFGRLAATHLRDHFEIIASDAVDRSSEARELGIGWGNPKDASSCPYVLIAVPVQRFGEALESVARHVEAGALVLDVASVKLPTTMAMQEALPPSVEILGTHPMFGPQSGAAGIAGHRMVLCPVRTVRVDEVSNFLQIELGLDVHVCDADTHDREIAHTQALAQFVGRALAQLDESTSSIRTPGYDSLREVADTVGQDSWELFEAIQNLNPYAAETRDELMEHLGELRRRLAEPST